MKTAVKVGLINAKGQNITTLSLSRVPCFGEIVVFKNLSNNTVYHYLVEKIIHFDDSVNNSIDATLWVAPYIFPT